MIETERMSPSFQMLKILLVALVQRKPIVLDEPAFHVRFVIVVPERLIVRWQISAPLVLGRKEQWEVKSPIITSFLTEIVQEIRSPIERPLEFHTVFPSCDDESA